MVVAMREDYYCQKFRKKKQMTNEITEVIISQSVLCTNPKNKFANGEHSKQNMKWGWRGGGGGGGQVCCYNVAYTAEKYRLFILHSDWL